MNKKLKLSLALFLAFWVPGHVIGPVVYLSKAAKELAKGNHIPIPDDGRKDELGELNRSFNEMGLRLTNMVAHLEEEVRLRTQELQMRNEELQQLSFLDGLTGIANRRQFDSTLKPPGILRCAMAGLLASSCWTLICSRISTIRTAIKPVTIV